MSWIDQIDPIKSEALAEIGNASDPASLELARVAYLGSHGTFTAPTEPGTYPYHCIFHGNMHGTITVK